MKRIIGYINICLVWLFSACWQGMKFRKRKTKKKQKQTTPSVMIPAVMNRMMILILRSWLFLLHVEGRYLKNEQGKIVNLHGFTQTYSPYFNNNA